MGVAELMGAERQFLDQSQRQDRELKPRIDMRGLDDHALIAPAGQQLAATLHASLLAAVLSLRVAATLRSSSDRLRW
jgi:hypothetical protein